MTRAGDAPSRAVAIAARSEDDMEAIDSISRPMVSQRPRDRG